MQFSIVTILLSIATITSAAVADVEGVRNVPRDSILISRQNSGRPVPTGNCCIASTSVKQDTCTTAAGATGRCVPGGQACKLSFSSQTVFFFGEGVLITVKIQVVEVSAA